MVDILVTILVSAAFGGLGLLVFRGGLRPAPDAPGVIRTVVVAVLLWVALFYLYQLISWQIWHGRGLAHGYGGDKSMANFVLEPPLVVILATAVAFLTRLGVHGRLSKRASALVAWVVALLVVLAVPALPE